MNALSIAETVDRVTPLVTGLVLAFVVIGLGWWVIANRSEIAEVYTDEPAAAEDAEEELDACIRAYTPRPVDQRVLPFTTNRRAS